MTRLDVEELSTERNSSWVARVRVVPSVDLVTSVPGRHATEILIQPATAGE